MTSVVILYLILLTQSVRPFTPCCHRHTNPTLSEHETIKKAEAEDGKFMKNSNFIPTTGERRFSRDLFWLFFEQKKVVVRSDNETATIVAFEEFYRLFCTFWRRLGWAERGRRMWILFYFISFSRARVASPDVTTPRVSICFHSSSHPPTLRLPYSPLSVSRASSEKLKWKTECKRVGLRSVGWYNIKLGAIKDNKI